MSTEKLRWFQIALQLKGSVVVTVFPRSLVCGLFGLLIYLLHYYKYPVSLPFLASLIPNIVLGLLLVFRTNTAYERYWEGRKCWGTIIVSVRNLARQIWVAVAEQGAGDREAKIVTLRMLVAFAVATKLHLRQEPVSPELTTLLPSEQAARLEKLNNPPLEVAFWIGDYLQVQQRRGCLNIHQLTAMHKLLDSLVEALSGCERILKTPMPIAYAIHLKQLLLLYCLSLPFQMVGNLELWTVPVVMLISFTLFGIEAIGIEIENPFGLDANDLPLDTICATMNRNIDDLITFTPSVRAVQNWGDGAITKVEDIMQESLGQQT
jgi:ion channel-forming bestrophin family protein